MTTRSADYYCMDGTIPRKRLAEMLTAIAQMEKKYGLRCANVEGELERTEAFGAEILDLSVKLGGTITGEHGVGFEKVGSMCVQFNSEELATFHRVKSAFDPRGLLNPGKAVPTLHRCASPARVRRSRRLSQNSALAGRHLRIISTHYAARSWRPYWATV